LILHKARMGKDGALNGVTQWNNIEGAIRKRPSFVQDGDMPILRLLYGHHSTGVVGAHSLDGEVQEMAFELALNTQRVFLEDDDTPLSAGEPRQAHLVWRAKATGQAPDMELDEGLEWMLLQRPWYLDRQDHQVGRLHTEEDGLVLARLLSLPPLNEDEQKVLAERLLPLVPTLPMPRKETRRVLDVAPQPVLSLHTLLPDALNPGSVVPAHLGAAARLLLEQFSHALVQRYAPLDVADVSFLYGEHRIKAGSELSLMRDAQGALLEIVRHAEQEAHWLKELKQTPLKALPAQGSWLDAKEREGRWGLERVEDWPEFIVQEVPRLRAAGWQVDIPPDFRHVWQEIEAWDATLNENESGWFDLDMGVMVDGQRLALTPLLRELFEREPRWLDSAFIEQQADEASIFLHTEDKGRIRVEAGRIKMVMRQLIDLFDLSAGAGLKIQALDVERLNGLPNDMVLRGAQHTLDNIRRIQELGAVRPIEAPAGLGVELRPYQMEGLSWLAHLRELKLGGILADDMGLGKTAQTLAFLLREKQLGRLDKPALVILPTSLTFNWRREAARIAPELRVLTLHGGARHEHFAEIAQHDLVLSTYPLVWRDIETLEAQAWSILILDEAQTVKNAASQAAQAVRRLKSEHRLSLTGTPMENHLGELWAQFDFLLPGFLGDSKQFTHHFRTPIEKQGDSTRRDLLARRLRPFMLRRRKEDVAQELPPKSIVVRSVQLEGMQRDLYETVRSAMDSKVREAIAQKGLARSHIIILEALLKLRQVCCDPRLLAGEHSGRRKSVSAKLELLMSMLPELVDEGRRILLFSQFTSMLDLIGAALDKAKIPYVLLTGQTRDREAVVSRFQNGEAPVFLISLKAGGVGLNLTEADTVIHYDPWWNPAAEDQATDRAHRIGQTKQVFVYKLVAEGSIEEKILALQEKKAALAAGVLGEDASAFSKFSADDLQALLAPLPKA
jgi:superfamily II DNA or RNA helicase